MIKMIRPALINQYTVTCTHCYARMSFQKKDTKYKKPEYCGGRCGDYYYIECPECQCEIPEKYWEENFVDYILDLEKYQKVKDMFDKEPTKEDN